MVILGGHPDTTFEPGMVVHMLNPRTQQGEAGGCGAQSNPWVYSEFKDTINYIRLSQKAEMSVFGMGVQLSEEHVSSMHET